MSAEEPRFTLDEIEASLNRVLTKRGFSPVLPKPALQDGKAEAYAAQIDRIGRELGHKLYDKGALKVASIDIRHDINEALAEAMRVALQIRAEHGAGGACKGTPQNDPGLAPCPTASRISPCHRATPDDNTKSSCGESP